MNRKKKTSIPAKAAIETKPPVILASRLALREGNAKKPIYQMHKWWARRLGAVFRYMLLAATTPSNKASVFKKDFFYQSHDLSNLFVLDPFVGGGTSLIEAAKCGASVIGVDIDPVACFVTSMELEAVDEQILLQAFESVKSKIKDELQKWYKTVLPDGRQGSIMYAFWVDEIECPSCRTVFEGHPHFQLRRFPTTGKQTVFCAHCGDVNSVPLAWKKFTCPSCRKQTNIVTGPVRRGEINCPKCETKTLMKTLFSEYKPVSQRLFALEVLIEVTHERVFKKADENDLNLFAKAARQWLKIQHKRYRFVPTDFIPKRNRDDRRPVSLGYRQYSDLFNPRQLLCLSTLANAINGVKDDGARELLALAFSDCLASNNMFCFYAFDYGKLTPLFGLHAYVRMSRSVENNVWGTERGRGSFTKCFNKMLNGKRYASNPFEYKYAENGSPKQVFTGESIRCKLHRDELPAQLNGKPAALLLNQSAGKLTSITSNSVDLILSDPPYYNNLAYSELSDFYHVWLKRFHLRSYPGNDHKRTPMKESFYVSQRTSNSEESHERFALGLSQAFRECCRVLKRDGLFVFTFHHNDPNAWAAMARAVLNSGFHVTNVFPVRSEGQSRFHSHDGNIKWDEVVVCRKKVGTQKHNHTRNIEKAIQYAEQQADRRLNYWVQLLKREGLDFMSCDARSLKSGLLLMYLSQEAVTHLDYESFFAKSYDVAKPE